MSLPSLILAIGLLDISKGVHYLLLTSSNKLYVSGDCCHNVVISSCYGWR